MAARKSTKAVAAKPEGLSELIARIDPFNFRKMLRFSGLTAEEQVELLKAYEQARG